MRATAVCSWPDVKKAVVQDHPIALDKHLQAFNDANSMPCALRGYLQVYRDKRWMRPSRQLCDGQKRTASKSPSESSALKIGRTFAASSEVPNALNCPPFFISSFRRGK